MTQPRLYTVAGVSRPLGEWARDLGVTREALRRRLLNGWGVADALTTPAIHPTERKAAGHVPGDRTLSREDRELVLALREERERLEAEIDRQHQRLAGLSDAALARKFEVSIDTIRRVAPVACKATKP